MVRRVAAGQPTLVLDVATGPAGVARRLAADTPAMIVGMDVSAEMLAAGSRQRRRRRARATHSVHARPR